MGFPQSELRQPAAVGLHRVEPGLQPPFQFLPPSLAWIGVGLPAPIIGAAHNVPITALAQLFSDTMAWLYAANHLFSTLMLRKVTISSAGHSALGP